MENGQPTSLPPPRRTWRTAVIFGLIAPAGLAGLTFLGLYLAGEWRVRQAEAELQETIASIDAAEPNGWRLDDLERQRKPVPDAENGAKVVIEAHGLWPEGLELNDERAIGILDLPPPLQLTAEQSGKLNKWLAERSRVLNRTRELDKYSWGRFPPDRNGAGRRPAIPYREMVSELAHLLRYEAIGHAAAGRPRHAWQSALLALRAGRTVGDEPSLDAQYARLGARSAAVEAMEQVLGRTIVAKSELTEARSGLLEEVQGSLLPMAIRGERAVQDDFFSRQASDVLNSMVKPENMVEPQLDGAFKLSKEEKTRRTIIAADEPTRRVIIALSHAYVLKALTQALNCALRPDPDCDVCLHDWEFGIREDEGLERIPLLAASRAPGGWNHARLHEKKNVARLHCAIVALAAEEFRLRQRRWCKDLSELVNTGVLARIPPDPFDVKPLRLRHTADGLVVYSVGPERKYAGDAWDHLEQGPARESHSTTVLEFRLWNPDRRGQAPAPLPKKE